MNIRTLPSVLAAVAVAFAAISSARADNLVQNGDFVSGLTGWKLFTAKDTEKGTTATEDGIFKLTAPDVGSQSHVRQLMTPVRVEPGKRYELTLDARNNSGKASELVIVLGPMTASGGQSEHYGLWRKLPLGTEWKSHKINFTTKDETSPAEAILKLNMGLLGGVTEIRNVRLIELP